MTKFHVTKMPNLTCVTILSFIELFNYAAVESLRNPITCNNNNWK